MLLTYATPETGAILARLEETTRTRRRAEVDDLDLVLEWADLHRLSLLPEAPGGESLQPLGGDGTPPIQELALAELGIARSVHTLAARAAVADALDLRHRLPRTWAVTQNLDAEVWVARKVATITRKLCAEAVEIVDVAVAVAIGTQAPSRILAIAEAKTIQADLPAHQAEINAERAKRYVALGRTDAHGLRLVIARVTAGDAHWVDAMVTRVAEILADQPGHKGTPTQELRSLAFGYLARPAELLTLLLEHTDQPETPDQTTDESSTVEQSRATAFPTDLLDAMRSLDPSKLRPRAVLYVHLHEAALTGLPGVARVEALGPHTLTALRELLGTLDVTVKGVIDLHDQISVNAYEHPTRIQERIHLLRPGDQFPLATSMSRKLDLDHPVPFEPDGPPGQTNSHDTQPLTRTHHRAKTHLAYHCTPLPTGEIIWTTPHGLHRLVDHHGTTTLDNTHAAAWTSTSIAERELARLLHRHPLVRSR